MHKVFLLPKESIIYYAILYIKIMIRCFSFVWYFLFVVSVVENLSFVRGIFFFFGIQNRNHFFFFCAK